MKKKFGILIFVSAILFSACSTDFEVIGNWKETMVVYGLLDQSKPKQYIKINKAFLGEGNAFEYAQIKDSVQYTNALSVTLKRIRNGNEIASYNLTPDNTIPKNGGIFYSQDQANAIYSFVSTGANALNDDSQYKLVIKNSETGKEVTSQTLLVKDLTGLPSSVTNTAPFSFIINGPTTNLAKYNLKFNSGANARIYQVVLRLHYTDSISGSTINDSLDWVLPQQVTGGLAGGDLMDFSFNGQNYMRFIGSSLSDYPGLVKRTAGKVDVIVIAAGDDLNTFINVNKPSTGIIQEKPEYTNITNGLGIFSARYYKIAASKPMNSNTTLGGTLDSLSGGQFTCKLKFVNINGVWNGCN